MACEECDFQPEREWEPLCVLVGVCLEMLRRDKGNEDSTTLFEILEETVSSFSMYTYCSPTRCCVIPRFILGLIQAQKLPMNGSVTSIINQEAVLLWGKNARQ